MLRVLVTGGNGFVGRNLVQKMLERGDAMVIIDSAVNASNVSYKEDIRNTETVSDIIKRERIDTCIHLAAKTSVVDSIANPEETLSVNVNGTLSILEACSRNDVKNFVFASSAAVYGEPESVPVQEDHPLKPLSPYGKSKVTGESLLRSYHADGKVKNAISLRFFNIYGLGQNPAYAGVITRFAERLSKGQPAIIYGDGSQTRDFISASDVASAIIMAAESATSGVFNIASGKPVSINDLVRMMGRIMKVKLEPVHAEPRSGEILNSYADVSKARDLLGFVAREDLERKLEEILTHNNALPATFRGP